MPTASNRGVTLYYETDGDGETVAFLGDVGYGAWQWGWQYRAAVGPYRTVVTDLRGAGRSDAPPGPYSVADLAADAEAVLSAAGARRAHLVGAGLGGMVALQLALDSGRVASLALLGTAASGAGLDLEPLFGSPDDPEELRRSLEPALSPTFRDEQPEVVEGIVDWRAEEDATREAWEAQAAAAREFDVRDRLHEVTVPALVVHGGADGVWPPERAAALADDLPRGEYAEVEGAGHLVGVEASRRVNDRLLGFLEDRD